jgi:hypothetical protein
MKLIKVLLFCLLLLLASWAWGAEIHDAAFKGDLAKDPTLTRFLQKNVVTVVCAGSSKGVVY